MSVRGAALEYGIASVVFLVILAVSLATQDRIAVNEGQGYDGAIYYDVAAQLAKGSQPSGVSRFASRLGTPLLAAIVDADDLVNGFQLVNLSAAFASTLLLLAWLRRYLGTPWLRVALVVVYASHWLQLVRFTVFYPVLVDACPQALCFAGLNCIAAYEKKPSRGTLAAIAAISAFGVLFREIVLLVPIAFLFVRNTGVTLLPARPYARVDNPPRGRQWIPLALATMAFVVLGQAVEATDAGFSASNHLLDRALSRNVLSYLLGWMVAFGPGLFLVLFGWRIAVDFFSRHTWSLVYLAGVAAAGWAASLESERHALNWGAPVAYLLIGLVIERHRHQFTGVLLAVVLVAQALANRLFWTIPQPADGYRQYAPTMVLTPLGPDVTYLHLFPDYVSPSLAWDQFWQYAALGAVILGLLLARTAAGRAGVKEASAAVMRTSVEGLRQLGIGGLVILLLTFLVAGGLAGAALTTLYRAQPVPINVRWKAPIGSVERRALERQLDLTQGSHSAGTTWVYMLTDASTESIRAVVRHPAVDDTAHVDRRRFRPEGADEREQRARSFGMLFGLAAAAAVGTVKLRARSS